MEGISRRRFLRVGSWFSRIGAAVSCGALLLALVAVPPSRAAQPRVQSQAMVFALHAISASRAAAVLHGLYPHARVRVDSAANAVVVVADARDLDAMRAVISGIDVRDPRAVRAEVLPLDHGRAATVAAQLRRVFPHASIAVAGAKKLLVRADPHALTEVESVLHGLDSVAATPAPAPVAATAVRVLAANPRSVARAVERAYPRVRALVSGGSILLRGAPEDISAAQTLAHQLDRPAGMTRYTQIYRLHAVAASSVGALVRQAFPHARVVVDASLNALSVTATARDQQRIAAGIAQLDGAGSSGTGMPGATPAYGGGNVAVVTLDAAMPGLNDAPSTSASDIASAVQQALGTLAPDLHLAVPQNSNQIVLTGDPSSIAMAKSLIAKLDAPKPLVELDTEVLEVDENVARNLGLTISPAVFSTYTEMTPPSDPTTGQPGRLGGVQALTRTPLQFTATLNALVQDGNARVLADPRIATLSGRTASIHAGDQISILTQTSGSIGTPVTQQLQTFNTGVSLDITPIVGPTGLITVALHPVVNSLTGLLNGVPQIATRDTQTVVELRNNQTLVIGGLIQEATQRSVTKVPLLGELPLIGRLFDSSDVSYSRNELVIVVTPHIVRAGQNAPPQAVLPIPTPQPLPTLPPSTRFPGSGGAVAPRAAPSPRPSALVTPSVWPSSSPSAVPAPTPSAFAQANVFTYGAPPQNAFAGPGDAPRIFYATLSPTVLSGGTLVTVSAIVTTNVTKVTLGTSGMTTALSRVGPSTWQGSFAFNAGMAQGQRSVLLQLRALRADGTAAQITIPVNIMHR